MRALDVVPMGRASSQNTHQDGGKGHAVEYAPYVYIK
jgi:hypothetical protein